MAGCSMPLAEWQPKHLASGTCGSVKKYNNVKHVSRLVGISVPLMSPGWVGCQMTPLASQPLDPWCGCGWLGCVLSVDTPKCWVFCGVFDIYQCSHASLM